MTAAPDQWSADKYNTNASFVYGKFSHAVLQLLDAQPGESVLDLGCGSGELTAALAQLVGPDGSILGLDNSPALLEAAQTKACSTFPNVSFVLKDGHDITPSDRTFDACFSNAALHWMKRDPASVVKGVYDVLRPGGRFVGEMGGFFNMVGVRSALHSALRRRGIDPTTKDPWYFPTPAAYGKMLRSAGFEVESCELYPRPTPLPTGLSGWLDTFAFAFSEGMSERERKALYDEVCQELEVDLKHESGWEVMYCRLRFKAVRP